MAAYFHGSTEMQGNGGDALQTLFLMNPAYVGYSDNQNQLPPPPSAASFILHSGGGGGGSIPGFNYNLYNPLEVTRAKQGLSLSLSSQQPSGAAAPEEVRVFGGAPENVGLSCKYLKVAQQLLDEVVSIGKEANSGGGLCKEENGQPKNAAGESSAAEEGGDGGARRGAELSTAEKQEIQMKKAKLVDMLNEVEQRYKQYEQQMQMVIGWFEQASGIGSAKTYTALALQTISKQFRCLKDAITAQIRTAGRRLGEDESGKIEASRLKYIDIQQRALHQQQFGMIQNNAWRPQRGLPERSVSVLRAWLFEHFLHPYPKDSDKIMLAKQAGLTRSQVSNWFINARVRLWKPMVEEMYAEEMKAQQQNGSCEEDGQLKSDDKQASTSQEIHNNRNISSSTVINNNNNNNAGLFNLIESSEMDIITQGRRKTPKKPRNNAEVVPHSPPMIKQHETLDHLSTKYGYERESREGFTITGAPASFFGTYPMMGMEQFQPPYSSNGSVSLTLGLHHCENISNQNRRAESEQEEINDDFGSLNYDSIQVQNSKRFAAQLMPDFVT